MAFVRANPIAVTVAFVAVASALFLAFPGIDIAVSEAFYRDPGGFFLRRNELLVFLRGTSDALMIAVVVVLVGQIGVKLARPERPSPVPPSIAVYLLVTLILGPGLVVNAFFKNVWGRPRPTGIELFGGEAPYVEVWRITDWCERNCSFVSGEASVATWFVAVAAVLPGPVRRPAIVAASVYAFLLSLNRILFGGHFLSDVVLSAGLTAIVILVVHRAVIEQPPFWLANDSLEAGLTRLGQSLGRAVRGRGSA